VRSHVLLDDEDAAALAAFAAATRAELAPEGAFQAELVTRIVAAAWRAPKTKRTREPRTDQRVGMVRPTGRPRSAPG
jgi:hypothetical protein